MNKESNARVLDPNRFRVAMNMPVFPGGPQNNNPMNVTDNASPPIQAASIYGDYKQNYPQMGSAAVNPMMVQNSGLQQNFPMGQRLNRVPFGMQQQPDTAGVSPVPDGMESTRLATAAQQKQLPAGPMGLRGVPAIPGGIPGNAPGVDGPGLMQGMPSAEMAAGKGTNMKTGKRGK